MPLITTSVPNLVQGVSQQPDNLRHAGQAESQTNALSSVVDGLTKRPNTEFVKAVDTVSLASKTHVFKRDADTKHAFLFSHNTSVASLKAVNLDDGNEITVSISTNAQSYLNSATSPLVHLRALTVADYTFVANDQVTVKSGDRTSDPLEHEALVFIKQGGVTHTEYNIKVNNTLATFDTSSSTTSSTDIAAGLATELDSQFPATEKHITGVTITNPTVNGVYKMPNLLESAGIESAVFWTKYKVEVTIEQAGKGTGAKGEAVIEDGKITGVTITHPGSGYDSDVATYPVTVTFRERAFCKPFGLWADISAFTTVSSRVTTAAVATVSTGQISSAGRTIVTEQQGNVLKISHSTGDDFKILTFDDLSDTGMGVVYKEVGAITDLPAKCFDDFRVKIRGDAEIDQDDYYVRFETKDNETFGEGAWVETDGWETDGTETGQSEGIAIDFDPTTLPVEIIPRFTDIVKHNGKYYKSLQGSNLNKEPDTTNGAAYWEEEKAIRQADEWSSTVTYSAPSSSVQAYVAQEASWEARTAGDAKSNPSPSFVGKQIKDLFFYKNRFGVLTESSVVFSEADEYFNFWRTTTQSLLDSAPIDVGISHTKVSKLKYAVPFQEKLILFSENSQFVVRGNELLTPKTVNISPVTEYAVKDVSDRPIALSNFLYFPYERGEFTGLYEYYVDKDSEVYEASELTAQVPAYLPSNVNYLEGSSNEDTIVMYPASGNDLYIYRYFWQGRDKIQSSWSKFNFTKQFLGMGILDSTLYLFTYDGTNRCLEKMDLSPRQIDSGKTYKILLDRRVSHSSLTRSYDSATKLTTVSTMPYDPDGAVVYTANGTRYAITRTSSSAFTVNADLSATDFYVGLEYETEFEMSTQAIKQPTERGGRSTSNFTKQVLRNGAFEYSDTGHFTVEVTPQYRDTYSYPFNPTSLGADAVIGSLVLDSGSFRFPVHCNNDDVTIKIKSSSALPMKVLSAEFESFVHSRSRRYGA